MSHQSALCIIMRHNDYFILYAYFSILLSIITRPVCMIPDYICVKEQSLLHRKKCYDQCSNQETPVQSVLLDSKQTMAKENRGE